MFEWVVSVVRAIGYPGIVFLMFLENVFPPLPSEGIMPFAGFLAARGELRLAWVIVAGTLGSVLGTLPLYYLGRSVGLPRVCAWTERYGRWVGVTREDIDRTVHWFRRYGPAVVLVGRSLPGLRAFVAVPAGAQRMPLRQFLAYNTIGSALWTTFLAYLGVWCGQNYERVKEYLGPAGWVVLGLFIAPLVIRALKRRSQPGAPLAARTERGRSAG